MYEYKTRIRYSELDESGRIRLLSLLNYLQDTSCFHGQSCGMSTEHYARIHRAWLLNYWDIHIDALPAEGEEIIAGTAPHDSKGLFAFRNFWLRKPYAAADTADTADSGSSTSVNIGSGSSDSSNTPDHNYYLRADSSWFLVNTDTMMPIRHTAEDIEPYGELRDHLGLSIRTRKVRIPDASKLQPAGGCAVTRYMIDSNHHVNNIRYIGAAYDALIDSGLVTADYYPSHIRAEYRHAAVYGDTLCFSSCTEGGNITVLVSAPDGREFCAIEFS